MTLDREAWTRAKTLFDAARDLPADRRPAYLAEACGANSALRREVETLLASYDRMEDFLEGPAAVVVDGLSRIGLLEGQDIGPYRLMARIGTGGMGDVYKARDTRLDRTVAIKVLPAHLATDAQAHLRFEREARAVAALNHPNICTLYDVGRQDEIDFLVLEYLEGETLAERLKRGPLPVDRALEYAVQIASALDRAHRAGIIHRDLKPGNIMLAKGVAKLLDFGLAKPAGITLGKDDIDQDLTTPGIVLGTAHYMAPEQIEGREADARTDIFSFGAVLYEMLTGKRAFEAPSAARLLAAIISSEPVRASELDPTVPLFVDYVIGRCLEKNPDDRWQTSRDLLAELERVSENLSPSRANYLPAAHQTKAVTRTFRVSPLHVALGVLVALTGFLLGGSVRQSFVANDEATWLSILPPPNGFDLSPDPAVSPDGRYVAYKAQDASHRTHIWLKTLGAPGATMIPGTDGTDYTGAHFWSPDSRALGFFAGGRLKRVDLPGGTVQILASAPEPRGGTWTPSGFILFNADSQNLMRVTASGGAASRAADTARGVRLFPHALPDGQHYLFSSNGIDGQRRGVYVASLDADDVRLLSDARSPAAYAQGYMLYARQRGLFAQPFDIKRLEMTGEPRQIADGIGVGYGTPLSHPFSVSGNGVLSYWERDANPTTTLTWYDRGGARLSTAGEVGTNSGFTVSRDGRRLAVERRDLTTNTIDIWLLDPTSRGGGSRLTANGQFSSPVISPGGDRLAVMQRGTGIVGLSLPSGEATDVIVRGPSSKWPSAWSADGRFLAFTDSMPSGWRLWTATAKRDGEARIYRDAPFGLAAMTLSPAGRLAAYMSDESGRFEVYVDSYPDAANRVRASIDGGGWPRWRADGKELFFLAPDRKLMAVSVSTSGDGVRLSAPLTLFEGPGVNPDTSRSQFEPSPDGSRFLFNARTDDPAPAGLTVVTNWTSLLRK